MLKLVALTAFMFVAHQVSAAPVTTLNCTVAKSKETFAMKVKIGPKVIEEIIEGDDGEVFIAKAGSTFEFLKYPETFELSDGSQVFEFDLAGVEKYTLTLTSASRFTKGTFELVVWDRYTSSNKPFKSPVSCTKK